MSDLPTDEVRLLANTVVGLGFSYRAFQSGLAFGPHMIGCDAGSSDFGPYYLGAGVDPKSPRAVKRDLEIMLRGARELDIPLIIGSCGGAGANVHLSGYVDIVRKIAAAEGMHFRLAVISAEQDPKLLAAKLSDDAIKPLGGVPELTADDLNSTVRTVGMMGVEPVMSALDAGADVVLAGRIADPAIYAAVPLGYGIDAGTAWLAAKSVDKGALATTSPGEGSPVLARVRRGEFTIEPTKPDVVCTVRSVGAMTMHENPDPVRIVEPGGSIFTKNAAYEQLSEGRVHVSGGEFTPVDRYTVKLEGAAPVGYRTILVVGIRDPRVIERLDEFLERYAAMIQRAARSMDITRDDYEIGFRRYGLDAVMGSRETASPTPPAEIGLIVDVIGRTAEISKAIGQRLGPTGSRLDITGGKLGGGGNFAYPFSPSVINMGQVFRWSVWHAMEIDRDELPHVFPAEVEQL
jgi:hypothetical protein